MFQDLVIWNETAHAKKTWSMNSLDAVFVATIQLLANCTSMQKEPNNAVGTYCESKNRIGYWAKSCHMFAMSSSDLLILKKKPSSVKQLASCAVKLHEQKFSDYNYYH